MVFGWFKRGRPARDEHAALPPEHRRSYRKGQSPTHLLRASVRADGPDELQGEFQDVSVGGAAVRFTLAGDPGLREGDLVELTVASDSRDELVRTPARVVYVEPGGDQHWRYGFEFVSVGDLYSQLDAFYARFFNRRASERHLVPAERRIAVKVLWGGNELVGTAHDLSGTGMCLALPPEKAERIEGLERVRLRFKLPGTSEELYGPARIRQRRAAVGRVLVGIEFDLEREDGLGRHADALREHAERRRVELERWQAAIGAA